MRPLPAVMSKLIFGTTPEMNELTFFEVGEPLKRSNYHPLLQRQSFFKSLAMPINRANVLIYKHFTDKSFKLKDLTGTLPNSPQVFDSQRLRLRRRGS